MRHEAPESESWTCMQATRKQNETRGARERVMDLHADEAVSLLLISLCDLGTEALMYQASADQTGFSRSDRLQPIRQASADQTGFISGGTQVFNPFIGAPVKMFPKKMSKKIGKL